MKGPVIALNLKAYAEATGTGAEALVAAAKNAAEREKNGSVIVCPPNPEIRFLCEKFAQSQQFRIFAQHVDWQPQGADTGYFVIEALQSYGCTGSLLNHATKKVGLENVRKTVERAKGAGFELIVCADSLQEAEKIAAFRPTAIAVEPPELIGTGISVSTAKPEIVEGTVKLIKKISPKTLALVGAGVTTAGDVRRSLELGADGVLLAKAYALSREPGKLLAEMLEKI